jgi:hypothetical protein
VQNFIFSTLHYRAHFCRIIFFWHLEKKDETVLWSQSLQSKLFLLFTAQPDASFDNIVKKEFALLYSLNAFCAVFFLTSSLNHIFCALKIMTRQFFILDSCSFRFSLSIHLFLLLLLLIFRHKFSIINSFVFLRLEMPHVWAS